MPARKKDEQTRRELREALKFAVDGEIRFGNRGEQARIDLDKRWDHVVELLERLRGQ